MIKQVRKLFWQVGTLFWQVGKLFWQAGEKIILAGGKIILAGGQSTRPIEIQKGIILIHRLTNTNKIQIQ